MNSLEKRYKLLSNYDSSTHLEKVFYSAFYAVRPASRAVKFGYILSTWRRYVVDFIAWVHDTVYPVVFGVG